MKEKSEYSKSGMKSTQGGGFDLKSQLSRQTGVSRITDGNAYLYKQDDQDKMKEINDAL